MGNQQLHKNMNRRQQESYGLLADYLSRLMDNEEYLGRLIDQRISRERANLERDVTDRVINNLKTKTASN